MIILITAVVSAALTWGFSEISHRHSSKRAALNQTTFLHKTEQLKILSELQAAVLEYYHLYSEFLWGSWEESEGMLSKKEKVYVRELWETMEQSALKLFALSSRVDHLLIRSQVDYLEEMARQYALMRGEMMETEGFTRSKENVAKQDQEIQRTAIKLNLAIGDQQLHLLGSQNPEQLH